MIALYIPGNSWAHRLPAPLKLGTLVALSVVISLAPHSYITIGTLLLVVGITYLSAGLGARVIIRQIWPLRWVILMMGVLLAIFSTPAIAIVNTGRVVMVVLLAGLVTCTTRTNDLLDVVRNCLRPFRRWGIEPELVALTILLTITAVPVIADFYRRVKEAQDARGVRLKTRMILPLMVMTLRQADDMADALAARGLA